MRNHEASLLWAEEDFVEFLRDHHRHREVYSAMFWSGSQEGSTR